MWTERLNEDLKPSWFCEYKDQEVAVIHYVYWAKIYYIHVRSNLSDSGHKFYEVNFEIAKLKTLITAKRLGWDIERIC